MTSTRTIPYAIVDVFADTPLRGNPLAVVPDADGLSTEAMQAIAAEFNLSETTFILRPTMPGADAWLRSFTPTGDEVSGAGHNALGAWWWLAETGAIGDAEHAKQQLGGAVLPVTISRTAGGRRTIGLVQGPPRIIGPVSSRPDLAAALGLSSTDITPDADSAVTVSTGAPHLLVELASRPAVDRAAPDAAALFKVLAASDAQGCYLYTRDVDGAEKAYARFFNPTVGIREDPATGSAAGPLGWLLARHDVTTWGDDTVILQGVKMGRESRLTVVAHPDTVTLHGSAVLAATGHLHLA